MSAPLSNKLAETSVALENLKTPVIMRFVDERSFAILRTAG